MKKVVLYLLAINIFLCYGGICNLFAGDDSSARSQKSSCHSMKVMENEQASAVDYDNKAISQAGSGVPMCQYFIVSKAFQIDPDFLYDVSIANLNFSEQNNHKFIFDKSSLKIPDRGIFPKLFLKNSSFLI